MLAVVALYVMLFMLAPSAPTRPHDINWASVSRPEISFNLIYADAAPLYQDGDGVG